MKQCCKNCKHSIVFKGAGGGKAHFCKEQPTRCELVGFAKYVKVRPNSKCEKYESRVKK